jgi:hypothetical protein
MELGVAGGLSSRRGNGQPAAMPIGLEEMGECRGSLDYIATWRAQVVGGQGAG